MRRLPIAIAVMVLIAAPVGAWAGPSLVGPSGLVTIPTAEVLGMTEWNAGISELWIEDGENVSVVYANVGLMPRMEVGASREDFEAGEAETLVNAKLGLIRNVPGEVSLAVGMVDVTDQVDRTAYAVLSHTLGAGLMMRRGKVTSPQLHVGIGGGRFDGLFGGVSATLDGRMQVMAEYDGDDVNLAAIWPVAMNLTGTVAVLNGLDDLGVGLALSSPW
ncbi:MAG: hypothetical protein JSV79_14080 [Armatimonadota bacterium]|nr:MAG: hypothetical protein JSV79_14080 [Armatimonadota bacterium]